MFRLIALYRGFLSHSRLIPRTWRCYSSQDSPRVNLSHIEDPKLRDIIESSNLGSGKPGTKKPSEKSVIKGTSTPQDEHVHNTSSYESTSPIKDADSQKLNTSNSPMLELEKVTQKIKEDIQQKVNNLPLQKEELRTNISKAFSKYFDSLQETIFHATKSFNDVTGYSAIEQLKNNINQLEQELKTAKDNVKRAKEKYTAAIQERSYLQKEVNELLTRKHNWTPDDLERFTQLYRSDHVNEQNEVSAQENLNQAEQLVDSVQLRLTQLILTRYHEEQIWSDKIRRSSTWGTWIIMGLNVVLFFTATFIVEPWKRRKMVDAFDDKVKLAITQFSTEQRGKMDTILTNQEQQQSKAKATESTDSSVYLVLLPSYTWENLKGAVFTNYNALISPLVASLQFDKALFYLVAGMVSLFSGTIASLLTYYLH